jgi:hypothetical protein
MWKIVEAWEDYRILLLKNVGVCFLRALKSFAEPQESPGGDAANCVALPNFVSCCHGENNFPLCCQHIALVKVDFMFLSYLAANL